MLDHINRIKSLHDQLSEMGIECDDKELAMILLASLPESYNPLITALDGVGEETLTFQKVKVCCSMMPTESLLQRKMKMLTQLNDHLKEKD